MKTNLKHKTLLRAKELAKHLSVSCSTIWYWRSKGLISSIKLSNKVTVFDLEEVEKNLFKSKEVSNG